MTKETALQMMSLSVPGQDLDAYIRAAGSVAILSPEEEKDLAEKYYFEEDLDAARQLVLSHLRFVVHIARSYSGYGLPQSDLIQEGNVGLMKAVKRFDPTKGVRLVSFAVHWIKAEIHEFVLKNWRIVKIATTKAQRKLFFNLRSQKSSLARLTLDEAKAIADDLGVTSEQVKEMEGRLGAYDAAFDAPVDDDSEAIPSAPAYYLEDSSESPEVIYNREVEEQESQQQLLVALQALDDRSRDILESRWLADEKATLHELADKYGVSAERIRQLESNALKKMKKAIVAA